MPGMGQGLPPPVELLRYKNVLLIMSTAYAIILVAGIAVNQNDSAIFYVMLLISMLLMALRSDQCMSQCVMPFAMFTMLIVLNDFLVTLSLLARPYPPASKIFSVDCPRPRGVELTNDTIVYLSGQVAKGCAGNYTLPKNTPVTIEENFCNQKGYVIANVLQILATVLDVVAAAVSWRMLKTALGAAQLADGGQPMIPPGGIAGMGPGGGGMGPGGMGPGGMGPGGGGPAGAGAGPAADQRGANFRAFQGPGQTLSG